MTWPQQPQQPQQASPQYPPQQQYPGQPYQQYPGQPYQQSAQYPGQQQPHQQQPQYPQQQAQYHQQQYPQQPPYQEPAPPPGVGGGQTAIALTTKWLWINFVFAFIKPKVFLNGQELPVTGWGRAVFPVQPGQHQLHVYVPYFLPSRIGPADLTVPVHPGQTVELEYAAPAWAFSAGSLGPPPQQYNGAVLSIVLPLAILGVFLLCCLIGTLGG